MKNKYHIPTSIKVLAILGLFIAISDISRLFFTAVDVLAPLSDGPSRQLKLTILAILTHMSINVIIIVGSIFLLLKWKGGWLISVLGWLLAVLPYIPTNIFIGNLSQPQIIKTIVVCAILCSFVYLRNSYKVSFSSEKTTASNQTMKADEN